VRVRNMDYSKWDALSASSEEDDGTIVCVPGRDGRAAAYSQNELRTERPWREQAIEPVISLVRSPSKPMGSASAAAPRVSAPAPAPEQPAATASLGDQNPPLDVESILADAMVDFATFEGVAKLNVVSTQEGIPPPTYSFTTGKNDCNQATFSAECKWSVDGQQITSTSEFHSNKKLAKAESAMLMIQHGYKAGVLTLGLTAQDMGGDT
jgi:hypothetical protein